jgi:TRAP-type C4-dicarboxylate transport system substrate-binding protein
MRFALKLSAITALAALVWAGPAFADRWDMPTGYPDGNYHTQNDRLFAEELKAATNGKIDIAIHSNQALFKMPEVKRAIQNRLVPLGEFYLSAYGNEDPIFEADSVPFLAPGFANARKLYDAQKPVLVKRLEKQGMMLLWSAPFPGQNLFTSKPIDKIGDLKGVKFRAQSAVVSKFASGVGATPVTIQQPEVPQAFATGAVDVMLTSAALGVETKAWDYSKYFYVVDTNLPRVAVVMNRQTFNGLDKKTQDAILAAASKAESRGWAMAQNAAGELVATLQKNGIKVVTPSASFLADMRKVSQPLIDDWLKRAGADGEAIVKGLR